MAFGVKFLLEGDYALFSRPEMKVERVSYDVPTPSALVGVLSSIFWHPGVKYVIDKIYVYNPIQFTNIRRNEVKEKLKYTDVKAQIEGKKSDISIYTSQERSQRASLLLTKVSYGVEAHFELVKAEMNPDGTPEKYYNILLRRLKKGQHFTQPCLGCREFPANVTYVEELPASQLEGTVDLGFMLYDLQYQKDKAGNPTDNADPRFYRPTMINGVIDVATYGKELLC